MGLSTIGGAFTPEILLKMGALNKRPIIFPLSNPSSKSECDFEAAVKYTEGRCLFASGSPFPELEYGGKMLYPGQGSFIRFSIQCNLINILQVTTCMSSQVLVLVPFSAKQ
jgi:malic enzyme